MEEWITGDSVTALRWQRLVQRGEVVWTICTTAANLENKTNHISRCNVRLCVWEYIKVTSRLDVVVVAYIPEWIFYSSFFFHV